MASINPLNFGLEFSYSLKLLKVNMKKLVILQTFILLLTVILGLLLKIDPTSPLRPFHPLTGGLAGLIGIVTVIVSFTSQQKKITKILLVIVLLLTVSAGLGGGSLKDTANYDLAYAQMAGSGFLAFITSSIITFKLKSSR